MSHSLYRISAKLSGIELTVLGLGETYQNYDDKLKHYYSFLHESTVAKDDDIVVFIDAYDVLLFPHSRRLHELIALSPTAIVACAESGVYPEPMVRTYPQELCLDVNGLVFNLIYFRPRGFIQEEMLQTTSNRPLVVLHKDRRFYQTVDNRDSSTADA
jgi:hypothetical protein